MNATHCRAVVLAFLACGCSTTHPVVEPGIRNPYTEAQFSDRVLDEEVTVEFTNGEEADAVLFQMREDSCTWRDPGTDLSRVARTRDIRAVVKRDHFLGAMEGLWIGGLGTGIVAGLVAGVAAGRSHSDLEGLGEALAFIGGAVVGAVAGTWYGASTGHKEYYEFVWFTRKSPSSISKEAQPEKKGVEQKR
jgi:hypothetical protein